MEAKRRVWRSALTEGLLVTLLFLLLSALCHARMFWERDFAYIVGGDSLWQMLPFTQYFERVIEEGNLLWSWSYGLGGDALSSFSFYFSTSPLFWAEYLLKRLFGAAGGDFASQLAWKLLFSVLRQALIMGIMYLSLRCGKGKRRIPYALMGAVVYGVSTQYFYYAMQFPFMTAAYVFPPLTMMAFRRWQESGKWGLVAACIGLTAANSFFFGYASCLLYGTAFLLFSFERGMSVRVYIGRIGRLLAISLAGVLLSAACLLPAMDALFSAGRSVYDAPWLAQLVPDFGALLQADQQFLTYSSVLSFPLWIAPALALPFGWKRLDADTRKRTLFATFWLLLSAVPAFSRLMNGFGYPWPRWYFLVIFAVAYAVPSWMEALEALGEGNALPRRNAFRALPMAFAICMALLIGLWSVRGLGSASFDRQMEMLIWVGAALGMACATLGAGALPYLRAERLRRWMRAGLCTLAACAAVLYSLGALRSYVEKADVEAILYGTDAQQRAFAENAADTEHFWRLHDQTSDSMGMTVRDENRALYFGARGASSYASLLDRNLYDWLNKTHLVTESLSEVSSYRAFGDRLYLEIAWNVRKKLVRAEDAAGFLADGWAAEWVEDGGQLLCCPYETGFEMWYDTVIGEETLAALDPLSRDATLLQSAYAEGLSGAYSEAPLTLTAASVPLDISDAKLVNCTLAGGALHAGADARIVLPIPARSEERGEYLFALWLRQAAGEAFSASVNGRMLFVSGRDDPYFLDVARYTFRVDGGAEALVIEIDPGDYVYADVSLHFLSYAQLPALTAARNRYNFQRLSINGPSIEGEITNDTPGILALSVPYARGWRLTLDGKPAPALRVNGTFLGMELPAGAHTVQLRYLPPLLLPGLCISLATLLACIAYPRLRKRRRK